MICALSPVAATAGFATLQPIWMMAAKSGMRRRRSFTSTFGSMRERVVTEPADCKYAVVSSRAELPNATQAEDNLDKAVPYFFIKQLLFVPSKCLWTEV